MAKATENTAPAPAPEAPAKKGGKLKLILIGVGALALVAGAFFGGMMMSKGKSTPTASQETVASTDQEVVADAEGGGRKEPEKQAGADKGKKEGSHGKGGGHGESAEHGPAAAPAAESTAADEDLKFEFDRITTNLLDPTMRQYVQMSLTLKAGSAEALRTIRENEVPLRDATLMLLGAKTKEEMAPAGRERLKRELLTRYEGIVEPKTIANIYISNIVVMRQ